MSEGRNYQWYILNVVAGSEQKCVREIKEKFTQRNETALRDTFVPYNQGQQHKSGRKVVIKATHMPGYVFIEMDYSADIDNLILSCCGAGAKFLNCDALGTPRPLALEEITKLKKSIEELNRQSIEKMSFEVGEIVKIVEGTFATMEGTVEAIDAEAQRIKVSISIFGQRHTFLDLDFSCVEKLS